MQSEQVGPKLWENSCNCDFNQTAAPIQHPILIASSLKGDYRSTCQFCLKSLSIRPFKPLASSKKKKRKKRNLFPFCHLANFLLLSSRISTLFAHVHTHSLLSQETFFLCKLECKRFKKISFQTRNVNFILWSQRIYQNL